jgi:hypothetical protein
MNQTPKAPGFYWAQWRKADPDTREGDELTPSDKWEPVDVFENADESHPEYLRVQVIGVERSQSLENFVWGEQILVPAEVRSEAA